MSRPWRGYESRDRTPDYEHFVSTELSSTTSLSVSFNFCIQINLLRLADYKSEI